MKYFTVQGDTFDSISKKVYGTEKYTKNILKANIEYVDVVIFSENIELEVPDIEIDSSNDSLPLWRRDE